MRRDFDAMRKLMEVVRGAKGPLGYIPLRRHLDEESILFEVKRLKADGLIESNMEFDHLGEYMGGEVAGLTDEGREFYSLIERGVVWAIVRDTLNAAKTDVPYPLLKEVCEEVVKRYVTSFIPEIRSRGRVDA